MNQRPDQKNFKFQLRHDLRRRRGSIDRAGRIARDTAINAHLVSLVRQQAFGRVAAYLAFDGEPDLEPGLLELAAAGVELALPVVHEAPGRDFITFRSWAPGEELRANRFGILEPARGNELPIPSIDLTLVPLVGWDRSGGRLGMGASFYDRAFQPFASQPKPLRMGVAYAVQECSDIPQEPWDIRLHAMLTENGWFTCGG